jgi:hypothetical protein
VGVVRVCEARDVSASAVKAEYRWVKGSNIAKRTPRFSRIVLIKSRCRI